jgi:hypothetical protein
MPIIARVKRDRLSKCSAFLSSIQCPPLGELLKKLIFNHLLRKDGIAAVPLI